MSRAIDIRNVPDELVAAVEEDAIFRNVSVQDAIVEKLSEFWRLRFEPSGYPFTGASGSTHWNVRVSDRLHAKIKAAAAKEGTMAGHVLNAVAVGYGLDPVSPRKRTQRRVDAVLASEIRRRAKTESIRALSRDLGIKRSTITKVVDGTY